MTSDGYPTTVDEFDTLPTIPMRPPSDREAHDLLAELLNRRAVMAPYERDD